eukprot:Sspe_Gene.63423::Locus_36330_Transcript_1_1_Confidence_1.000_Length_706::g.63423::m.63423
MEHACAKGYAGECSRRAREVALRAVDGDVWSGVVGMVAAAVRRGVKASSIASYVRKALVGLRKRGVRVPEQEVRELGKGLCRLAIWEVQCRAVPARPEQVRSLIGRAPAWLCLLAVLCFGSASRVAEVLKSTGLRSS